MSHSLLMVAASPLPLHCARLSSPGYDLATANRLHLPGRHQSRPEHGVVTHRLLQAQCRVRPIITHDACVEDHRDNTAWKGTCGTRFLPEQNGDIMQPMAADGVESMPWGVGWSRTDTTLRR